VLGVVLALVVIGSGAALFQSEAAKHKYVQTEGNARERGLEPIAFNFEYSRALKRTQPPGSYVQLEKTENKTLVARMRISPIAIPPQPGLVSGYLPITATALERDGARRYKKFRLQFEGRARVNFAEGYQIAYNAQLEQPGRKPRSLFGREVIIPEPYDFEEPDKPYPPGQRPTRGVLIQMLATTLDASALAQDIGDTGILKKPYRSFRFGN